MTLQQKIQTLNNYQAELDAGNSFTKKASDHFIQLRDEVFFFMKDDVRAFGANLIWIIPKVDLVTGKNDPVLFIKNDVQEDIYSIYEEQRLGKLPIRILPPKYRQAGISTDCLVYALHHCLHTPDRVAGTIADKSSVARTLSGRLKKMVELLPAWYPNKKLIVNNAQEIHFSNGSKYILNSAGNPQAGRGETWTLLHLSEAALYENDEEIVSGALQGIATAPETIVIMESTGNGPKGVYYRMVKQSREGKGIYKTVFLAWYRQSDYKTLVLPKDFKQTTEEEELIAAVLEDTNGEWRLTDYQLMWRRNKILELKNLNEFHKEFPTFLEEVFASTDGSYFGPDVLIKIKKQDPVTTFSYEDGFLLSAKDGDLKVYSTYDSSKAYRIAVDTAEGSKTGDYTCIIGMDHNGKTVFTYKQRINPNDAINIIIELARMYQAEVHIEKTGLGIHFIESLKLHVRLTADDEGKYCFRLDQTIRDDGLALLKRCMLDDSIEVISETLQEEMVHFVKRKTGNKYEAMAGHHDDEIITFLWIVWLHTRFPMRQPTRTINKPRRKGRSLYVRF